MTWALTLEGRSDPSGVVLLIDDEREAELLAMEIRRKGIAIVVRPHRRRRPALNQPENPSRG